jgi:N-acetylmuramic acid 6-phosphate etherase
MPPTFGTPPSLVQAVMAGGQDAVFKSKEGVEDNFEEGGRTVARLHVTRRDVIVGVSASGLTPYVRGALTAARNKGARIIFITCWPGTELQNYVDLIVAPAVGPEVIAGSTRMKGGLAQKMVMNLLSTTVMVRLGYVDGNLMTHLVPASEKLRDRGVRIVMAVGDLDRDAASALLAECGGSVAEATRRLRANGSGSCSR